MILIAAKIKCDHYDCEKEADVFLELKEDNRAIPELPLHHYPDNWTHNLRDYDDNKQDFCPDHKKIY